MCRTLLGDCSIHAHPYLLGLLDLLRMLGMLGLLRMLGLLAIGTTRLLDVAWCVDTTLKHWRSLPGPVAPKILPKAPRPCSAASFLLGAPRSPHRPFL